MGSWNDFNDAQSNTNLIPKGTLAKVRLTIRPGGFDDASQGWTGGYATRGSTGAVYLNGEFTVTEGPYARRKIFTLIGLYSPKGPDWTNMGRSLVRGMLNSARGDFRQGHVGRGAGRRGGSVALPISTGSSSSRVSISAPMPAATTRTRSVARSRPIIAIMRRSWARRPSSSVVTPGRGLTPQQNAAAPTSSSNPPAANPGAPGRPSWAQ